jgi:hypothetical protein
VIGFPNLLKMWCIFDGISKSPDLLGKPSSVGHRLQGVTALYAQSLGTERSLVSSKRKVRAASDCFGWSVSVRSGVRFGASFGLDKAMYIQKIRIGSVYRVSKI